MVMVVVVVDARNIVIFDGYKIGPNNVVKCFVPWSVDTGFIGGDPALRTLARALNLNLALSPLVVITTNNSNLHWKFYDCCGLPVRNLQIIRIR